MFLLEALENIWNFIRGYIYNYSYLLDGRYYSYLWDRYYTVAGFFLGAAAVLLVFFADYERYRSKSSTVIRFIRSLALIALLNSMGPIYNLVLGYPIYQQSFLYGRGFYIFDAAANPIAGAILTLVVFSSFKRQGKNAFCFGTAVYAVTLLMFNVFSSYQAELWVFLVLRAVCLGFICIAFTKLKYYHISLIIFTAYYFVAKTIQMMITQTMYSGQSLSVNMVISNLRTFVPDLIIFAVIFAVAIIYERAVLAGSRATV